MENKTLAPPPGVGYNHWWINLSLGQHWKGGDK